MERGSMHADQLERWGVLYALGLGPGDPGLVTVRAAELLHSCPVVAFPVDSQGDPGRSYRIAEPYLAAARIELPLRMPMTGHVPTLTAAWGGGDRRHRGARVQRARRGLPVLG
ncbi:MAG: SAM-dependent methyltransferase [Thermoleophilia bacterium]|nr:SAM-dependent methyltransferase [Thermoleophilia bacterium]